MTNDRTVQCAVRDGCSIIRRGSSDLSASKFAKFLYRAGMFPRWI